MRKCSFRLSSGCVLSSVAVISIFLLAQNAAADQEITVGSDFGVGARAMGMGGAFVGVADDATALYWNPAGLSQIRRMEMFGALSHEKLDTEAEYFGTADSIFVTKTQPNSFSVVLPVSTYRGGLAFAFGVNRVQSFDSRMRSTGFNSSTPEEDPLLYELSVEELTDESGGIYSWSFGAAVDIAPGVSVGGALNFLSGDYLYELELDGDDIQGRDPEFAGISFRDIIDSDYSGVEGRIGLLASIVDQVRLGVTIDIPLDFGADEYWSQETFYLYDDGENESEFDEGFLDYDMSRPFRFGGGIAIYPVPGATIAADLLYTDWTQTDYSEAPSEDRGDKDYFAENYRDTSQMRLGGEYTIPGAGLSVRAGYMFDPLPYTPKGVIINTDRRFITLGLGMMLDEVLLMDVAYMRGSWKEKTDDNIIKEERKSNRIFLSAGYRF